MDISKSLTCIWKIWTWKSVYFHFLLSVCVWNCQTMDYPLPLPKSIIGHVFSYACLCDLLPNGGSLTIVDVHGWCVFMVIWQFFDFVHGWRCFQMRADTHTHWYKMQKNKNKDTNPNVCLYVIERMFVTCIIAKDTLLWGHCLFVWSVKKKWQIINIILYTTSKCECFLQLHTLFAIEIVIRLKQNLQTVPN